MLRKLLSALGVVLLLVLAIGPGIALAHQTIQVGNYDVEYGWTSEPVLVNQPNAIVINVAPHAAGSASAASGTVSLMAPTNGAGVQGDHVDVMVQFAGLADSAASNGVHWHLLLDDKILAMEPLNQTTATIMGLTNGSHTIAATLGDSSHNALGTPVTAKITVSGAADTGTPAVNGGPASMDMGTTPTQTAPENIDVSGLKIEAVYGGETKTLTLQPLGENTPGQFVAPILPTRQGQITIRLSGKLGGADIKTVEVQPEEVQSADIVAFPKMVVTPTDTGLGTAGWLGVGGLVFGLLGTLLGAVALLRRK
jgi:hypothetical protein